MDHRVPGSGRYSGEPAARGAGDMVLLGLFLTSGSSASVGIEHGGGTAAWIMETLVMSCTQGRQFPLVQEIWYYYSFFLASGSSVLLRIECGGGVAIWIAWILEAPSVQDASCLSCKSYGTIRIFFQLLAAGIQRASLKVKVKSLSRV